MTPKNTELGEMTIDENSTGNEPTGQLNKDSATASQTEAEKIAALQKQTEEQEALNITLTQELKNLRTQLKEKEERGAARRKKLNPKNLAFNSPADETEGGEEEDEEKTPERGETESESDDSPPHLQKKKKNRGSKGAPPTEPIHINLGDPIPSDITPESLAEILKQILLNREGSTPNDSHAEHNQQANKNAERSTDGLLASDPTGALTEAVAHLLLEKRPSTSPNDQTRKQSSRGTSIPGRSSRSKEQNMSRDELAEIRARLKKSDSKAKLLRSQIHRAISSAPEIAQICEDSEHKPFSARIINTRIVDPGRLSIQKYDDSTNPKDHINAFRVALSRAAFRSIEEKDA